MKKELVFYVSKVKTHEEKVFFRFINNQNQESYWCAWDAKENQAQKVERTFGNLKFILVHFSEFIEFKIQFLKDTGLRAGNPFSEFSTPYVYQYLTITDQEEEWWRKLVMDLCIKKL